MQLARCRYPALIHPAISDRANLTPLFPAPIKTTFALIAGIAICYHFLHHFRGKSNTVKRITCRQNTGKGGHHINHQINAYQIIQTENACLWNTHWPADKRIGIFQRNPGFQCFMQANLQGKYPHTVAQKPWRVRATHDPFSQYLIIKQRQPVQNICPRLRPAYQLQQAHIAHRIKIMGNGKTGTKIRRHIRG